MMIHYDDPHTFMQTFESVLLLLRKGSFYINMFCQNYLSFELDRTLLIYLTSLSSFRRCSFCGPGLLKSQDGMKVEFEY